jgi:hypothetical protein
VIFLVLTFFFMIKFVALSLLLLSGDLTFAQSKPAGEIELVRDGVARGVIVVGKETPALYLKLAGSFADIVERATGARLAVLTEGKDDEVAAEMTRLFIGPTEAARQAGLQGDTLPEETCRILIRDQSIFVWGNDALDGQDPERAKQWSRTVEAQPTRWGLNQLLEEQLGVRWLWPGRLGTHVPKQAHLRLPKGDLSLQPKLSVRRLALGIPSQRIEFANDPGLKQIYLEAADWLANHQGSYRGARAEVSINHAFNHWWEKYGAEHPEWFVPLLSGQPFSKESYHRKLRFTLPEVIEQIAIEYQEAGAPKYWNVSENDGAGFDVSPEALALDLPRGQSIEDIWNARGNLTARYVTYWNRIHDRLKQINPEVTLVALAYSCYHSPPPPERPLTARMVIGMVCGYTSQEHWQQWRKATGGGEMVLRPNWGWVGANAPHLPLEQLHSFLQFAAREGMTAFHLDSIMGYWGTQGPNYYLMARMAARPELSKDQVLAEYTSAFGAGANSIRAYLDHWQRLADEYGYSVSRTVFKDGRYHQLVESGVIDEHWFSGPRQAMIHLYNDEVLAPALKLLDEADAQIGDTDAEARQRVQFLRDGLREMRACRDLVALGSEVKKMPNPENVKRLAREAQALDQLRQEIRASHAIWAEQITTLENRRRLPIRPENLKLPKKYDGEDI